MLRATGISTARGETTSRGIAMMLLAMFIFACQDAVSKHLAATYAVPQIMMVRYLCFLAIALVLCQRTGGVRKALKARRPWLQVLRCVVMIGETALFVMVMRLLPLADAHAVLAIAPIIVTILSIPLLGEKVGIRRFMAVLVGFAGMMIILRPGAAALEPGALLALLCAFMFGLYIILTRKVSADDSAETSFLYLAGIGVIGTVALGPVYWVPPDAVGWGFLVLLACMAAFAHLLLMKALEVAPASLLQPLNYTLLVWATLVGFVVFGDFPDSWTITGAAVIVASGLYTIYRERKRKA